MCNITKKKPMFGNNVSKAINKTKQISSQSTDISFYSKKLDKSINLKFQLVVKLWTQWWHR